MTLLKVLLMSCFILFFANKVMAETFCASTVGMLNQFLIESSGNEEDDVIRIVQGTYFGNFTYDGSIEENNLTIEGGYTSGCTNRTTDPSTTILDSNKVSRVLTIEGPVLTNNIVIDGITLQNGSLSQNGGGLFIDAPKTILKMNNNRVINNSAGTGGGIYAITAEAVFTNNIIRNNVSNFDGGGVYILTSEQTIKITFVNNVINNNNTEDRGGGIFLSSSPDTILVNNTISDNIADEGGGIYIELFNDTDTADLFNNIIWFNIAGTGSDLFILNDGNFNTIPSEVMIECNNFDQGPGGFFKQIDFTISLCNIDSDPKFINKDLDNYRLRSDSPCIDQGDNETILERITELNIPVQDKDGNQRIIIDRVDIGAYEYLYILKVEKSGQGTVTSSPSGISCGQDCTNPFDEDEEVTLIGEPNENFGFAGCSDAGDCDEDCSVTMDGPKTCTATFKPLHTLTVKKEEGDGDGDEDGDSGDDDDEDGDGDDDDEDGDSGDDDDEDGDSGDDDDKDGDGGDDGNEDGDDTCSGTITGIPNPLNQPFINCGSDCIIDYIEDTTVILDANSDDGCGFAGWSGDPDCTDGIVVIDKDKTCKAAFKPLRTLTVTKNEGICKGTVTSNPEGISCGDDCNADFIDETQVTLIPTPEKTCGSVCSGDCDEDCSVMMNTDKTCTVSFTQKFPLTVVVQGTGRGTVITEPSGINCGTECTVDFLADTKVQLNPTPGICSELTSCSGDCNADCSVTMDGLKTCNVNFDCMTPISYDGTFKTELTLSCNDFGNIKKVIIGEKVKILEQRQTNIMVQVKAKKANDGIPITLIPKDKEPAIELCKTFNLKPPEITSCTINKQTRSAAIEGRFFSSKKGKVKVFYLKNGKEKRKRCKAGAENWSTEKVTCMIHKKVDIPNIVRVELKNKVATVETTECVIE